jgi:hypothetical protein
MSEHQIFVGIDVAKGQSLNLSEFVATGTGSV